MKANLHIELVTETYPPEVNGVALTVESLQQGLLALGHHVALIRPKQTKEYMQAQPNLMLVNSAPIPYYPGLRFGLPAGRRLLTRWHKQRPDAIYIATEGPLGWSALRVARQLGIPTATGFHTRFDDYVARYGANFLAPWAFAWLRRFHNRSDVTLVPTLQLRDQLIGQGFKRVQRLGRAVDTQQFHPGWRDPALRASWGLADGDIALLSVGRLATEKNLALLVRAFRALQAQRPHTKLIFVGDGPARTNLQLAHPDAIFCGIQRGNDLARHYASADLFLFPSLSETFGNVTLEAMASALATVAFDYGAAREHLRDVIHGAAVPMGNEDAFIGATLRVAMQGSLPQMGAAARLAVQHLHPAEVANAFAQILRQLSETQQAA